MEDRTPSPSARAGAALRRHFGALAFSALAAPALLAAAAPAGAAEYDWCAPVVVRPDQYFLDSSTCANSVSDAEIGAGAEAVLVGDFTDVSQPRVPAPSRTCVPNPSHAANAAYVQRLRTASRGRPVALIHMHRFELVPYNLAAQPGFSAAHLLQTATPWSQVTGFFQNDRTGVCASKACSLSDSWKGMAGKDSGIRLRDAIDASGGSGAYKRAVYYLARPDGTGVFYPTAAIARLTDPAYRAFRVAEAREALRVGGYDAIDLNHKLHQYETPFWLGSNRVRDVASMQAQADTFWTAAPSGYGYPEYVQGWSAMAADLQRAGVPYSVTIALRAWISAASFDDKATGTDEAALIREVMKGARYVLLDRPRQTTPQATVDKAVAELAAFGVKAIPVDQTCGLRIENQLLPPAPPSVEQ